MEILPVVGSIRLELSENHVEALVVPKSKSNWIRVNGRILRYSLVYYYYGVLPTN